MSAIAVFREAWRHRHQLGDHKQSRQLAAFLPAALEIQDTPPHPLIRWLAWSLLAFVLVAVLWACLGHVNVVASADGKILPGSRVKQIQPLEKGVVKTIWVTEGDYVTQGQTLIEFDTTLTTADQNRLETEWHSTQSRLAVHQALLELVAQPAEAQQQIRHEDVTLPALPNSTEPELRLYRRLLWQQWQQYWSQRQSLQSTLNKTRAEQGASREMIIKLEQTLPIVTKRATTSQHLYRKGLVSEADFLQAEQERIQQFQDLATQRQRRNQFIAAQSEVREQINTHVAQTRSTLLAEIVSQQHQMATLEEELTKARDVKAKQVLYAPVAGRVQGLAVHTVGGVVTEAQQLMLIVPDEDNLEVEVFLDNKDIGFVHERMPAEIKIHTFPFTKYGVIDAHVSHVSDDAMVDEQRGLIYSMQLRLTNDTIWVDGQDVRLRPGMAVTAEVKTGKRRIIEFFLAPLLRYQDESIRER